MKWSYVQITTCDECGKEKALCFYEPSGPFRGVWRCRNCKARDNEALADVVEAATKRLNRLPKENENNG